MEAKESVTPETRESASRKRGADEAVLMDGGQSDGIDEIEDEDEVEEEDCWEDRKDSNVVVGDELDDFEKEDDEQPDEGEAPYPQSEPVEPSYVKFGSIEFFEIAKRLEDCWNVKAGKKKVKQKITTERMLKKVLPPKVMQECSQPEPGGPPQSSFPLVRLLCPEKDGSRRTYAKEATLAKAYIEAFNWSKDKKESKKLLNFHDPAIAGTPAGDFSVVLHRVLEGEDPQCPRVSREPSTVTISQLNQALDEFAALANQKNQKSNHDWRKKSSSQSPSEQNTKLKKLPKISELRADWVRQFLNGGKLRMSPVEHKWLARILMERMQFGLGFDKILTWIHKLGPALWSGHNSLKAVCNTICQPDMSRQLQDTRDNSPEGLSVAPYMIMSAANAQMGKPFTPMLSNRTSFQRIMTELSGRHREYIKNPDYGLLNDDRKRSAALRSLAMNHPVFSIETKLDGERMLIHYYREGGLVKIHSRQGVWHSDLYSPVLGPAIRRAVGDWGLDLIIDGEVLAWDNAKKETVPFGNNKTVAKLRHNWMRSQGLLDKRDKDLHKGDGDARSVTLSMVWNQPDELVPDLAGKECWLQFVAFDVLFVGGPKAQDFLASTISPFLNPNPGSILGLDGLERKKVLYRLVKQQTNEVEIVATTIVRPNGKACDGNSYFSFENPNQDNGHPSHALDSITGAFHGHIPDLEQIDAARKGRLTDEEISQARAELVNQHYSNIVENLFLEGLLFKDLAAPYVLDKASRLLSYWHKFKPDYFNGAAASDLDLVVVGAYFATGLRHSGKPSSFLCACVDSNDEDQFYPFCRVNAGSMESNDLKSFLEMTGFKAATSESALEYGSWFRIEDFDSLPSFISDHSNVGDGKPWRPAKKDNPDIWIDPRDSVVVTLNAGEVVFSSAFPVGITLRFPRITRIRSDKTPSEIETDSSLWDIYNKVEAERTQNSNAVAASSGSLKSKFGRFLTESQYGKHKRDKKGPRRTTPSVLVAPDPIKVKSKAFAGLTFCVLDGKFVLDSVAVEEKQGWVETASRVKEKIDIEAFIKQHGGIVVVSPDHKDKPIVLGGQKSDSRVHAFIKGNESARCQPLSKGKNPTQRAIKFQRMAEHKGVLRWTFPYSLLERWNSLSLEGTIKSASPSLLVPHTLDYLALPSLSTADQLRDLGKLDSVLMMQRALEFVSENRGPDASNNGLRDNEDFDWYKEARKKLDHDDFWVLSCGPQRFWPEDGNMSTVKTREIVIYADVFPGVGGPATATDNAYGRDNFSPSSDAVISVLPLVRVYGASVSSQLNSMVTHIVCDLQPGIEFTCPKEIKLFDFRDPKRGSEIMNQINLLDLPNSTLIVSPSWVRDRCQRRWDN